jgi:hypothetical protein
MICYNDTFVQIQDYEVDGGEPLVAIRELNTIMRVLKNPPTFFHLEQGKIIFWQTTSKNCCNFLLRGSRNPTIQKKILDIKLLENQLGIVLVPLWAPVEHPRYNFTELEGVLSDNSDEWSVDQAVLSAVFTMLHVSPTVDAFAAPHNAICSQYFSRQHYPSTAGVNFFAQSLVATEYYFCCPPVTLIIPCFHVFQSQPALQGLLLVPERHWAPFFGQYFSPLAT